MINSIMQSHELMSPLRICKSDLRIEVLDSVILKMMLNKSPGSDGLMTNFYEFFWKYVRNMLLKVLKECIEKKELINYETRIHHPDS